jgi:Tfp pilus assembly protein PilE
VTIFCLLIRVARFFLVQQTKMGKKIQTWQKKYHTTVKYTKMEIKNVPNGHEIYTKCFLLTPSKMYQNWHDNNPSGNPAFDCEEEKIRIKFLAEPLP